MNLKELQLYYEDKSTPWKVGSVPRKGFNESMEHFVLKLRVCTFLASKGGSNYPYICEAKFKGHGRMDVFTPLNKTIYECVVSETKKKLIQTKSFPEGFKVYMVKAEEHTVAFENITKEVRRE